MIQLDPDLLLFQHLLYLCITLQFIHAHFNIGM